MEINVNNSWYSRKMRAETYKMLKNSLLTVRISHSLGGQNVLLILCQLTSLGLTSDIEVLRGFLVQTLPRTIYLRFLSLFLIPGLMWYLQSNDSEKFTWPNFESRQVEFLNSCPIHGGPAFPCGALPDSESHLTSLFLHFLKGFSDIFSYFKWVFWESITFNIKSYFARVKVSNKYKIFSQYPRQWKWRCFFLFREKMTRA